MGLIYSSCTFAKLVIKCKRVIVIVLKFGTDKHHNKGEFVY